MAILLIRARHTYLGTSIGSEVLAGIATYAPRPKMARQLALIPEDPAVTAEWIAFYIPT
jgi:hypothetical protein